MYEERLGVLFRSALSYDDCAVNALILHELEGPDPLLALSALEGDLEAPRRPLRARELCPRELLRAASELVAREGLGRRDVPVERARPEEGVPPVGRGELALGALARPDVRERPPGRRRDLELGRKRLPELGRRVDLRARVDPPAQLLRDLL